MTAGKKLFCAAVLVLTLVPLSAHAQWVRVDSADPATFYVDPNSIQQSGSLVKVWELIDYHEPQLFADQVFWSTRVLREFDCERRELRTLAFTIFAQPMARGEMVHSHRAEQPAWELVEPYSVGESSYKLACR